MTENKSEELTYEYIELVSDSSVIPLLMDGYESFGWEVTKTTQLMQEKKNGKHLSNEKLGLRRNRHLMNKVELTRLQRNFDACIVDLNKMEANKKRKGVLYAISAVLIGCVLLAISVFAVVSPVPNIPLIIIFSIPGFICWIGAYPVYKKMVEKETKRINPLIDDKYEEIYEIMEKAKKLL